MAGLALNNLYGQPGLVHSPQFKSFAVEGNKVRIKLEHADGLRLRGDKGLRGFAIKGEGGNWVWAQGAIEGQEIVLWSDDVPKPSAIRYAWAFNPLLSVENSAGLPLRPFRTDTDSANWNTKARKMNDGQPHPKTPESAESAPSILSIQSILSMDCLN